MDNRPIGIFDSGIGGMTSLHALRRLLPQESIVYFGDTGRMPYGAKSRAQICTMTGQDLDFLESFGVKAILAACVTISANAPHVLDSRQTPCFDVLRPAAKRLLSLPGTGPIAVAATEASVKSGALQAAIKEACPNRELIAIPCPEFASLIEHGHRDDEEIREAVRFRLRPAREAKAEVLLLGCTHYGIIAPVISDYLDPCVTLVSAAECGAAAIAEYLQKSGQLGGEGQISFYTSGDAEEFSAAAQMFLGSELRVETVAALPVPEND